ncbi:alpha-tocopherol transfer protein-like isoform X1 [Daktulosphaira vitifoliae]|uniref:alpha-tocopherol transfer protein-like isoform X1 n=1 Tax=Daktulosphaira vitifoliae TaxID=58002 RepID=UPI0021AA1605|nr:alpha-tocopherol transfer protein-like isoform X1 [Daktulosphaira vitifoliae]
METLLSIKPTSKISNSMSDIKSQEKLSKDDQIDSEIDKLIEWLKIMPHLPNINDREWLKNCYIGRKCRLERTKESLNGYFCCRATMNEFFGVRDPLGDDIQTAMRKTWFGFCNNLTDEGYQVLVVKNMTDVDVPGRYLDYWVKYYYMSMDLNFKTISVKGVIIIYDMSIANKNEILTQMTPTFLRNSLDASSYFPYKLIQVHFVNAPSYSTTIFNLLKTLVTKKIQSRIFMHQDPANLLKYIPKHCIPSDYGGEEKSIKELGEHNKQCVLAEKDLFLNGLFSLKADMEKKPVDTNSNEQSKMFGFDGNFKKLNID